MPPQNEHIPTDLGHFPMKWQRWIDRRLPADGVGIEGEGRNYARVDKWGDFIQLVFPLQDCE